MKKLMVIGILYLIARSAFCAPQIFTPTFVGCFPDGICFIGITPLAETACEKKGQVRFDISLPGSSAQYSTALASKMANKKLLINVTDVCSGGYPIPDYIHTSG